MKLQVQQQQQQQEEDIDDLPPVPDGNKLQTYLRSLQTKHVDEG
jgi:hypothetical protein